MIGKLQIKLLIPILFPTAIRNIISNINQSRYKSIDNSDIFKKFNDIMDIYTSTAIKSTTLKLL